MRASIPAFLTAPAAGPIASMAALAFAGAFVGAWVHQARTEAALKAQVAQLTSEAQQSDLRWQAKFAAARAEAAGPAPAPLQRRLTPVADGDAVAARLANIEPAGFDACARMQAADAAVLGSLHGK